MRKLLLISFLVSMMGCMGEIAEEDDLTGDQTADLTTDEETEGSPDSVTVETTTQALSVGTGATIGGTKCPVGNCYNECDANFNGCTASTSTCLRRWKNCTGVCDGKKACRIIDL